MQFIEVEKQEQNGISVKLRTMDVSKTTALEVEMTDVPTVRTMISRFHKNTAMRFETEKTIVVKDTPEGKVNIPGILVWRIA